RRRPLPPLAVVRGAGARRRTRRGLGGRGGADHPVPHRGGGAVPPGGGGGRPPGSGGRRPPHPTPRPPPGADPPAVPPPGPNGPPGANWRPTVRADQNRPGHARRRWRWTPPRHRRARDEFVVRSHAQRRAHERVGHRCCCPAYRNPWLGLGVGPSWSEAATIL